MKVNTVRKSKILYVKPDDGTDYGNRVYLLHDDGYISMYAHLKSVDHLLQGDILQDGECFAEIGGTGYCPSGPHLHFSLFAPNTDGLYASNTIDPVEYLRKNGYPTTTKITNNYGSKFCNPKLEGHEGFDFSAVTIS